MEKSMTLLSDLETSLNDIFVKKAPPLPASAKRFLVQYLPYIALIIGFFSLVSAWSLWHLAHSANAIIDYANSISRAYGGSVVEHHVGFSVWLAILTLIIEALLYIAAFGPSKVKEKAGWNLLFYAALVNVLYGIFNMFTSYGGIGSLLGVIIGSGIGLYILFQIRESYVGAKTVSPKSASKK